MVWEHDAVFDVQLAAAVPVTHVLVDVSVPVPQVRLQLPLTQASNFEQRFVLQGEDCKTIIQHTKLISGNTIIM